MKNVNNILGLNFEIETKDQAFRAIDEALKSDKQTKIFTPNPQILLYLQKNPDEYPIFNCADILLPDGTGVVLASRILGGNITERITGIDTAEYVLTLAARYGYGVFLLGAKDGVAKLAAEKLVKIHRKLHICGSHHGYFSASENSHLINEINRSGAQILFVCFGSPAQEFWISKHASELKSIKLFMGLGGSLDVWSGNIKRAPKLFRVLSLEWLWRAALEPHRLKILLDIPHFLFLVTMKRIRSSLKRANL